MKSQEIFILQLKKYGLSATKPRKLLFSALEHHQSLSMAELVAACPQIDRSSVYRSVAVLEKAGVIVRIPHGWKYSLELSDAFHEHHHHATCTYCGARIALPEDSELEKRLHKIARDRQFELDEHQVELYGRCSSCVTTKL